MTAIARRTAIITALLPAIILIVIGGAPPRVGPTAWPTVTRQDMFGALLAGSRDLGTVAPSQLVDVLLLLRDPTTARQAAAVAALYNPRSARFGRYLSPGSLAALYGPSAANVRRISALLQRAGLTTQWQRGNDWLLVTGQARRIDATFKLHIHAFRSPRGIDFYASPRDPVVPRAWRGVVSGAGHVSSYVQPLPQAIPAGGLQPMDLLSAYDIKPLRDLGIDGTGETVVFWEADGFAQSDFNAFTRRFGLPPMHPIIKAGPTLPPGIEDEMDLEAVHAIAPGATLVIYSFDWFGLARKATTYAQIFTPMVALQSRMVNENPGTILSLSWALCETMLGQGVAGAYQNAFAHADLLGESVFAATGDNGAYESLDFQRRGTPPAPQYIGADLPAAAPGLTAVGGTRLSVRTDKSWYNETVWENPIETGGGGGNISAYFQRPAWQQGPGVLSPRYNPNTMRGVPDVSADADPVSGAAIYTTTPGGSRWWEGGGTSQSTPIWAGITALINEYLRQQGLHRAGFLNPALYHLAATPQPYPPFHDITMGTNLYYPATPGYDLATGLGTPDVWNLTRDLATYQRNGGQ